MSNGKSVEAPETPLVGPEDYSKVEQQYPWALNQPGTGGILAENPSEPVTSPSTQDTNLIADHPAMTVSEQLWRSPRKGKYIKGSAASIDATKVLLELGIEIAAQPVSDFDKRLLIAKLLRDQASKEVVGTHRQAMWSGQAKNIKGAADSLDKDVTEFWVNVDIFYGDISKYTAQQYQFDQQSVDLDIISKLRSTLSEYTKAAALYRSRLEILKTNVNRLADYNKSILQTREIIQRRAQRMEYAWTPDYTISETEITDVSVVINNIEANLRKAENKLADINNWMLPVAIEHLKEQAKQAERLTRGGMVSILNRYSSTEKTFTGCDIHVVYVSQGVYKVVGELSMITVSTHREKVPVPALGHVNPKGHTRGRRSIAGTLVFAVFDKDAFLELSTTYRREKREYEQLKPLVDQLPPFDVVITFRNEHGAVASKRVYKVEIQDDGETFSVDDMLIERVMQYVASDADPMEDGLYKSRPIDEGYVSNTAGVFQIADMTERRSLITTGMANDSPFDYSTGGISNLDLDFDTLRRQIEQSRVTIPPVISDPEASTTSPQPPSTIPVMAGTPVETGNPSVDLALFRESIKQNNGMIQKVNNYIEELKKKNTYYTTLLRRNSMTKVDYDTKVNQLNTYNREAVTHKQNLSTLNQKLTARITELTRGL